MKKYAFFILSLVLLAACKPTEKNYQKAYDKAAEAAQRKSEAEKESLSGGKLDSFNAPRMEVIEGDTLFISSVRVKPFETTVEDTDKAAVAVAHYRMPTNARKHAENLKAEYPEAMVVKEGDENYYVIIERAAGYKEAAPTVRRFREAHPDFRYIGLSEGPLIVFIR